MGEHNDLEQKLEVQNPGLEGKTTEINNEATATRGVSPLRNYVVDTTAAWLYWTPLMIATETASGMKPDEILI